MITLGILGASGRMGRAIAEAAADAGVAVADAAGRSDDAVAALAREADVLVDFTAPGALAGHLAAAVVTGTPIVVGTTGFGPAHLDAIGAAARHVPILQAYNMSLGIALLRTLVREAASRLDDAWDIEILEMHHRHKRDAPSGTALLLGASARAGRGEASSPGPDRMRERSGEREHGGIYYASLRGGSVAGDHQVIFAGDGERIELGHRAEARGIFARGAVRAATWLAQPGRAAGRYAMEDVLGIAADASGGA